MAHLAYVRLVRILFHEHAWKLCPGRATVVIANSGSMREGTKRTENTLSILLKLEWRDDAPSGYILGGAIRSRYSAGISW